MESPKFGDIDNKSWVDDDNASNFFGEFEEQRVRCYSWPASSQSTSMRAAPSYAEAEANRIQPNNKFCSSASSSCSSIASQHNFSPFAMVASPPTRNEHYPLPLLPLHPLRVIVEGKAVEESQSQPPPQSLQSIPIPPTTSASTAAVMQQEASTQTPKRTRRRSAADDTHPDEQQSIKKQNLWGGPSYSDLIARALASSADGHLKLGNIYQWFTNNVAYFAQRSGQEESLGWKNSVRHNLSLHNRFLRVQGADERGSACWMINPDAKAKSRRPMPWRKNSKMDRPMEKTAMDGKERCRRKIFDGFVETLPKAFVPSESPPSALNGNVEAGDLRGISFANGSHETDQFDANTYKSPEALLSIGRNPADLSQPSRQVLFPEPVDNSADNFSFCWMDAQFARCGQSQQSAASNCSFSSSSASSSTGCGNVCQKCDLQERREKPSLDSQMASTGNGGIKWTAGHCQTVEAGANFLHWPDLMLSADDVDAIVGTEDAFAPVGRTTTVDA